MRPDLAVIAGAKRSEDPGEPIGVDYLYSQAGKVLEELPHSMEELQLAVDSAAITEPVDESLLEDPILFDGSFQEADFSTLPDSVGPDNIPGYGAVVLANYLADLRDERPPLSPVQSGHVIVMCNTPADSVITSCSRVKEHKTLQKEEVGERARRHSEAPSLQPEARDQLWGVWQRGD
nr:hypothetical protein BaRGS_015194 [Batillaria attramentaria]